MSEEIQKLDSLKALLMFSQLSDEQLQSISDISTIQQFLKGENLFRTGDNYRGFFILIEGAVKVYDFNQDGKETVIHIFKPVNSFADIPLFEGKDYPVCADSLTDIKVIFIPKEKFISLIKKHPEVSLKMLAGFAKRMKYLVKQIEDLSSKEVINRLAKYILLEVKKSGTEKLPEPFIKLEVPKSVIASYIGTITETFSRTLKKMQKDEIIRVQGKKIFITNPAALKKLANS